MSASGTGAEARVPRRATMPGAGLATTLLAMAVCAVTALVLGRVALPRDAAGPSAGAPPKREVAAQREVAARWPDMRLDLNRAGAAELAAVDGIGPRLAERIVADRERNGPFRSIEDLARVDRVGPVLVERAAPFVVVDPRAEPPGEPEPTISR